MVNFPNSAPALRTDLTDGTQQLSAHAQVHNAAAAEVNAIGAGLLNGTSLTDKGGQVFNVKAYDAKGDGVADDAPSIRNAISDALLQQNAVVYFPSGTYLLNSLAPGEPSTGNANILYVAYTAGSNHSISFVGDGATLTSPLIHNDASASLVRFFFLEGYLSDGRFEGIQFVSTHAHPALGQVAAIQFAGWGGTGMKRWTVRRCKFLDFGRCLAVSGVDGISVENNTFLATYGRDSGSTDLAQPHVAIWCFVNASGQTQGARISNNYFDGCTSGDVSANTNKQGMDGFLFGASRGWTIVGNTIKRFGTEGIYLNSRQGYEATRYPVTITGNIADGTLPTGTNIFQTWGIRTDEHDCTIVGNSCYSCYTGIQANQGSPQPTAQLAGLVIAGNDVSINPSADFSGGIKAYWADYPVVSGNRVEWLSAAAVGTNHSGIKLYKVNYGRVANTLVFAPSVPTIATYGLDIQAVLDCRLDHNETHNCTVGIYQTQIQVTPSPVAVSHVRYHRFRSCTNNFGGDADGVRFLVVDGWENPVSADRGDADVTLNYTDLPVQMFLTALTVARTVTLVNNTTFTGFAPNGVKFRIVRQGLGAFTLTITDQAYGVVKTIPSATAAWCDVELDGAGHWRETGYGTL